MVVGSTLVSGSCGALAALCSSFLQWLGAFADAATILRLIANEWVLPEYDGASRLGYAR